MLEQKDSIKGNRIVAQKDIGRNSCSQKKTGKREEGKGRDRKKIGLNKKFWTATRRSQHCGKMARPAAAVQKHRPLCDRYRSIDDRQQEQKIERVGKKKLSFSFSFFCRVQPGYNFRILCSRNFRTTEFVLRYLYKFFACGNGTISLTVVESTRKRTRLRHSDTPLPFFPMQSHLIAPQIHDACSELCFAVVLSCNSVRRKRAK